LRRIIKGEGGTSPIIANLLVLLLLPLVLYEGYLLMETAQNIEVEGVSIEDYNTEMEDGIVTKIEMDLNIHIRNRGARSIKLEKLEYDLMIMPEGEDDIEFDRGEVENIVIRAGRITTISISIENDDEDEIEDIQNSIMEDGGDVEAVAEVHVPLLQIFMDFPITTVTEQFEESFDYEPVVEEYNIYEDDAELEKADETDKDDYILKVPYEIKTNDNEFLSGEVDIEIHMDSDDGEIKSSDNILLEVGDDLVGEHLEFGFDEEDIEELLTEEQDFILYSIIEVEDYISFRPDYEETIESPAMLEGFDVDEGNSTLERTNEDTLQAVEDDDFEYVLRTPYEVNTNDPDFISGGIEIDITMSCGEEIIESSDILEFDIGYSTHEDEWDYIEFGLNDEDVDELLTEEQDIEFTYELTIIYDEEEVITFQPDDPIESVHSDEMLVKYELDVDEAELNETEEHFEVPYLIETQDTAFFKGEDPILVNTTMESEDGTITSSAEFFVEIGEEDEGMIEFSLDEDEIEELIFDSKRLRFTSEVEREGISFEYEHDEIIEWDSLQ